MLMAPLALPSVVAAQGVPHCAPGESPAFTFGFAELKRQLGPAMGEPVECAHPNDDNGDVLQQTSTGLSFWRKSTNTPTFTDGYRHWGLTPAGMVAWVGSSIDPPGVVPAPSAPAPTAPASRPVAPPAPPAPAAPTRAPANVAPTPPPPPPTPARPAPTPAPAPQAGNCDPSYPDFCIPPFPPDLNCDSPALQGRRGFTVRPPDRHRFDGDKDGIGCE